MLLICEYMCVVHYIGGQLDTGEVWGSSDRWVQGGGVTASKATVKKKVQAVVGVGGDQCQG